MQGAQGDASKKASLVLLFQGLFALMPLTAVDIST